MGTRYKICFRKWKKTDDILIPSIVKDFIYLDVDKFFCENSSSVCLTTSGEMFSWGSNEFGRLGHGDELDRTLPTLVKALQGHKILHVAMGLSHTLVLEENGLLWTFGSNKFGQLGIENTSEELKQLKPVTLSFFKK